MAEGLEPRDAIRVYDPGEADGDGAYINLPRSILSSMGIPEGQPILIQVRDDAPEQVVILGPATPGDPADPYTITATPEPKQNPDYPPRYSLRLPREWKKKPWRQPEEDMNDRGDDPYSLIDVDYDLGQAIGFLRADGALVIPL